MLKLQTDQALFPKPKATFSVILIFSTKKKPAARLLSPDIKLAYIKSKSHAVSVSFPEPDHIFLYVTLVKFCNYRISVFLKILGLQD